jgi:ferredoxin
MQMKQIHLKKIRLVVALVFFVFTIFIFLDFRKLLPDVFYEAVTYLQFIPSLLKFISVLSLSALGFMIVILLTALFGRVYCSAICPLGILQDVILWFRKKTKKKFRYKFSRPVDYLRYPFLALPVIAYLAGTVIFISLLDPFSNFGRIFSDFFQPVYIGLNNTGAKILEKFDIFFLYPEEISLAGWITYLFPLFILILVIWMSLKQGRLYCNTICPVGTLLGLLSRVSLFRIRIHEGRCTKCGQCAIVCKSTCINLKKLSVDFSRCVGCYNCISVCPEDAIKYFLPGKDESLNTETDHQRRKVISSIGLLLFGIFGLRRSLKAQDVPENENPTEIEPEKHFTVTPPGSLGIKHFTTTCTACHLCVSACPTQVLQPSLFEYGITGIMQPYMDYATNYCNFDCVICSEVCPTGAILSLSSEAKKTVQIGQVNLILENCVVYTDHTSCGSCSEHCPTQAVRMVPFIDGLMKHDELKLTHEIDKLRMVPGIDELTIPEIRPEICVGCGACEHACPTKPYKAIYVDGHYEHQVAQEPEAEELEQPSMEEEFPF